LKPQNELIGKLVVVGYLACVHINTSTSSALYGFPYTSCGKHEFACISMSVVHILTSMGYLYILVVRVYGARRVFYPTRAK